MDFVATPKGRGEGEGEIRAGECVVGEGRRVRAADGADAGAQQWRPKHGAGAGTVPHAHDPATLTAFSAAGEERVERDGDEVHVYMTAMRSHFTPDVIRVRKGDKVMIHVTNIEQTPDATHGFAIPGYNIQVSLDPATFGRYNPLTAHATAPLEITSSVTITCSRGMATTIGLDRGLHADYAHDTTRAMKHVSRNEYLSYDLYQDAVHTTLWGTSGSHLVVPPVAEDTKPRTFLIFGRVPAGQDVSIGDYHDTVVAVVNF